MFRLTLALLAVTACAAAAVPAERQAFRVSAGAGRPFGVGVGVGRGVETADAARQSFVVSAGAGRGIVAQEELLLVEDDQPAQNLTGPLCDTCLKVFGAVSDSIGTGGNITRDALEQELKFVCEHTKGIEKFCSKLGPHLIDLIYRYIKEVQYEIDPAHICKLAFLCFEHKHDLEDFHLSAAQLFIQMAVSDN